MTNKNNIGSQCAQQTQPPQEVVPDTILLALQHQWFKLAKNENYPKTPEITRQLDELDVAIRERTKLLSQKQP